MVPTPIRLGVEVGLIARYPEAHRTPDPTRLPAAWCLTRRDARHSRLSTTFTNQSFQLTFTRPPRSPPACHFQAGLHLLNLDGPGGEVLHCWQDGRDPLSDTRDDEGKEEMWGGEEEGGSEKVYTLHLCDMGVAVPPHDARLRDCF